MSLQVISASPARAGTLLPLHVTFRGAHNHHSLQLIAHDLLPKSRVETQVKLRLEFANMPVTSSGGAARWRWLRLPFTASVKQPRFYDHGMYTILNNCSLCLKSSQRQLHPNHCCIYTLLRFALVSHTCQPPAAQSATRGKPNAVLSTTRNQQTTILPPVLLISLVNLYLTCPVVVPTYRSVRTFPYMNSPKW